MGKADARPTARFIDGRPMQCKDIPDVTIGHAKEES